MNKVPSVAIAHRPARERAILVDPPRAKALGDQLSDNPLDFVSWISPAISGPFFFHGFLRPISRAREIENDAFHGHFTG